MLTYCRGTDLTQLADHLVEELEQNPLHNPLAPEIFVVQNHGMARWLSLYIAEKQGIAANLKFEFPAERIWSLIRVIHPDVPDVLPSDRLPMTWAIMHILENNRDPDLEVLHQYIEESDPLKQELRRWKLAGRIADVFDQYLTYRPEVLPAWEERKLVTKYSFERWQSVLWRKLVSHWDTQGDHEYGHRASLQQKIIKAIDNGAFEAGKLPGRLTIFGVSTMPPVYLKILIKLSKLTDVYFYILESGNEAHSLNDSLGKTGREYRSLLEKFINENGVNSQLLNLRENEKKNAETLFATFQSELLGSAGKPGSVETDGTVQVHSCHSPRREVEVLYDRLLAFFDEDESLNPSDVLVLTPDLETYAPEVDAVFGTVEEGLPEIVYHFAEQSATRQNLVNRCITKLLELVESRFKVTDILDLLDSKPIQEKFGLSDEKLNTLERWLSDNRIRWGIDGFSKISLDLPASDSFTWQAGLNRMMLGYAMKQHDDELFHNIYPYGEIEQSEDILLAGRFSHLMNLLFGFHREIKESRTIPGWEKLFKEWIFKFLPDSEVYFKDLQSVRDLIEELSDCARLSGFEGRISYQIFKMNLEEALEKQGTGGGRSGKGVTFSSMIPMRNIPAKVICMLGMNDGVFPRSKVPAAFDLINRDPQPGDRSHSDEDRQLFLEALLAADERIYFSFVGQSNRHDTEFPPSVVLRELIDHLIDQFELKEEELITKQRLQAFSVSYFQPDSNQTFFSYSDKNKNIAEQLRTPAVDNPQFLSEILPDPASDYKRLSIGELIRFFQHPAKYLLQNRFDIHLYQEEVLDEDTEPFRMNGLEGFLLGQELLDRYLDQKPVKSFKEVAFATDFLPDAWPGEEAFRKKAAEVKEFGSNLKDILGQKKLEPLEVNIEIEDFRVTGRLNQLYENEQILYRFGGMRPKDLIELWVRHLAFQTVKPESHSGQSRLYTRDKKQPYVFYQLSPISTPGLVLQDLLKMYWSGLKDNIMFFPEISFAFAHEVCYKNEDAEKGIQAAAYKWTDNYSNYKREGDDPYNKLIMGGGNPLESSEFQRSSILFWEPFFNVLNKMEE